MMTDRLERKVNFSLKFYLLPVAQEKRAQSFTKSRPLQVLVRKLFTKMDNSLSNISPSPQKYLKTSTDREGLTGKAHMAMEVRVFQ